MADSVTKGSAASAATRSQAPPGAGIEDAMARRRFRRLRLVGTGRQSSLLDGRYGVVAEDRSEGHTPTLKRSRYVMEPGAGQPFGWPRPCAVNESAYSAARPVSAMRSSGKLAL